MEEKSKIMKIYERLYFILSTSYFLLSIAIIFYIVDGYFREINYANSLFMMCIVYGVPLVIVCILCSIFSLRIRKAIKKNEGSKENDLIGLSLGSLFIFVFLAFFSYVWLISSSHQTMITVEIIIFLFVFLTLINIMIIALYFAPKVRAFRQSLKNIQKQGEKNG